MSRRALALRVKKFLYTDKSPPFFEGKSVSSPSNAREVYSTYNQRGSGTYSARKTQQIMIANALRREARKALTGVARRRESLVRRFLFSFCD